MGSDRLAVLSRIVERNCSRRASVRTARSYKPNQAHRPMFPDRTTRRQVTRSTGRLISRPGAEDGQGRRRVGLELGAGGRCRMTAVPLAAPTPALKRPVVLLVCVGIFMTTLDASIVNISLPAIARAFGVPLSGTIEWVIIGYLVVVAALLLTFGRLSDLVGRTPDATPPGDRGHCPLLRQGCGPVGLPLPRAARARNHRVRAGSSRRARREQLHARDSVATRSDRDWAGHLLSPNTRALMDAAPAAEQGQASGLLATARIIGQSMSVAIAGAVFTGLGAAAAGSALVVQRGNAGPAGVTGTGSPADDVRTGVPSRARGVRGARGGRRPGRARPRSRAPPIGGLKDSPPREWSGRRRCRRLMAIPNL
jgi:hypothetical protein